MSIKNIPTLQPGIALVLAGPQGCGKSTLARELAEQRGAYAEIEGHTMGPRFSFAPTLRLEVRTIIIDGLPRSDQQWGNIKWLLTADKMLMRPSFASERVAVPVPAIILCVQEDELPEQILRGRSFELFHMPVVV